MPLSREVSFRKIPGASRLFLDYLDLAPAAFQFYQRPPAIAPVEQFARDEIPGLHYDRIKLAAILKRQNETYEAPHQTLANIEDLSHPECVAVVTGQQVGIFTGPLYTVYKALTAIRIAAELRSRNLRAVPVFWMECEDHDLAEVTHTAVTGADSVLHRLNFLERLFGAAGEAARPVGTYRLPEGIREVTREYADLLPTGKHREDIRSLLDSAYGPGIGFADAFGLLMTRLFGSHGLVLFNAGDRDAKPLAALAFRESLRSSGAIQEALAERNRALAGAGYHTQVSLPESATVLFLREGNERRALIRDGSRFVSKNTDRSYQLDDLLSLSENEPDRFSPNVLLRPLIQDHLFPTAAYVAGPGEVAYFAQTEMLYRILGRPMPAIWPRAAFTLIEPEVQAAMTESNVSFEDCLTGRPAVVGKIMGGEQRSSASAKIKGMGEELERVLTGIRPELILAEASLGPALDTAKKKILHNIDGLHAKLVQLEGRGDGTVARKADLICNNCYPNKNLQEREFGAPVFLSRHGVELLDTLYSEIHIASFAHRVIAL
jgi:bacillithiol biosynthesis cysteine-adding enzyme BshC